MPVVNYLWNPLNDNIVREFDDNGNVIADYTTESRLHGNVISQRRNGVDSVYHYDGQGSTIALTNAAGDVTDTYSYNAFGEVIARTGDTVNPFQFIGQKGYYTDAETGALDVRQRPYDPPMGRWLSPDPFFLNFLGSLANVLHGRVVDSTTVYVTELYRTSWNPSHAGNLATVLPELSLQMNAPDFSKYTYCAQNPTTAIDPSGLLYAKTPFYNACVAGCDATYPSWWQQPFRSNCIASCGTVERRKVGVPEPRWFGPWYYGRYCGYFNSVKGSCISFGCGSYMFTNVAIPWDALDTACALHDCCFESWGRFLLAHNKCNEPLCSTARLQLEAGCPASMTPRDCMLAAAQILASPLCQKSPIGSLLE